MSRLMVCDDCWALWGEPREIKTMGGGGPCCVCLQMKPCGGPITEAERDELRSRLKPGDRLRARTSELIREFSATMRQQAENQLGRITDIQWVIYLDTDAGRSRVAQLRAQCENVALCELLNDQAEQIGDLTARLEAVEGLVVP